MELTANELARIAWAQAWQLSALIVAVALATRFVCRNRPHLAHALWLVVLVKCVTPPLWSSPSGIFCWMQTADTTHDAAVTAAETELSAVSPNEAETGNPFGEPDPFVTEPETAVDTFEAESIDLFADADASEFDESVLEGDELASVDSPAGTVGSDEGVASRDHGSLAFWIVVWLAGSAFIAILAVFRLAACLWTVKRAGWRRDPELDDLVARLSTKLKLRRRVRLLVTNSRVGPAVVGLFRPLILLPEVVVRGKSNSDLEPILVHELIHVRRGDLWVGMLQVVASAAWWFHPLVWLTGRLAAREAERCCDEESIAALGRDPADYAHSLLDVLEMKQTLQPVPSFPGVRPVEITSKRLERIMSLRQGCHKRTPWWCWICMALVGVAVLPGAAIIVSANGEPADLQPPSTPKDAYWSTTVRQKSTAPEPYQGPQITKVYKVDDLLRKLLRRKDVNEAAARQIVLGSVKSSVDRAWQSDDAKATGNIRWFLTDLAIRQTAENHRRIAKALTKMRAFGFEDVTVNVWVVSGSPKEIQSIKTRWTVYRTNIPTDEDPTKSRIPSSQFPAVPIDRPLPGKTTKPRSKARLSVETTLPVLYEIMDKARTDEVVGRLKKQTRTSFMHAPKVNLFNGQTATVLSGSQRPYVVGFADGKPQIRVISEGLRMRLRPLSRKDGSVWLDLEMALSDIREVRRFTFQHGINRRSVTLQTPTVATTRLDSSVVLQPNKTLLIGGLKKTDKQGKPQSILVMLQTSKFRLQIPTAPIKTPKLARPSTPKPRRLRAPSTAVVPAGVTSQGTGKPGRQPLLDFGCVRVTSASGKYDLQTTADSQAFTVTPASVAVLWKGLGVVHASARQLRLLFPKERLSGQKPKAVVLTGNVRLKVRAAGKKEEFSIVADKVVIQIPVIPTNSTHETIRCEGKVRLVWHGGQVECENASLLLTASKDGQSYGVSQLRMDQGVCSMKQKDGKVSRFYAKRARFKIGRPVPEFNGSPRPANSNPEQAVWQSDDTNASRINPETRTNPPVVAGSSSAGNRDSQHKPFVPQTKAQVEALNRIQSLGGDIGSFEFDGDKGLEVELYGRPVTDADLAHVAKLPNVAALTLWGTKVTDAGLARYLPKLPHLVLLSLEGGTLTGTGLAGLSPDVHKRLMFLKANNRKLTDGALLHLAKLKQLQGLQLFRGNVSLDAVKALKKQLPDCRIIDVQIIRVPTKTGTILNTRVTREYLSDGTLRQLKGRGKSDVWQTPAPKRSSGYRTPRKPPAAAIKVIPTAATRERKETTKDVDPNSKPFVPRTKAQAEAVGKLQALGGKVVILKNDGEEHVLVLLEGRRFTDADLVHVTKIPKVAVLMLHGTKVTDAGLARCLPKLTHLGWLNFIGSGMTGAGLSGLSPDVHDRLIAFQSSDPLTDVAMQHLGRLTSLKRIIIEHGVITDAGLKHLAKLKNLKQLDLDLTGTTGSGLKHLAGLPKLGKLHLAGPKLTDATLLHLVNLKQLRTLELFHRRVSPDAGKALNPDAVKALKQLLPKCRVIVTESTGSPVNGATSSSATREYLSDGTVKRLNGPGQTGERKLTPSRYKPVPRPKAAAAHRSTKQQRTKTIKGIAGRKPKAAFVIKGYPVADLVITPQKMARTKPTDAKQKTRLPATGSTPASVVNMAPLIKLIETRIAPNSWESAYGPGTIKSFRTTLSLIIRQTPEVHRRIADLLSRLRRLQDVQVTLAIRMIEVPKTDPLCKPFQKIDLRRPRKTSVILPADQARNLMKSTPKSKRFKTLNAMKLTLFRGQPAAVPSGIPADRKNAKNAKNLWIVAPISEDRRFIRLRVALNAVNAYDALATVVTVGISDGKTVMIDLDQIVASTASQLDSFTHGDIERVAGGVRRRSNSKRFLLVTPKIIVQEEEEVKVPIVTVTPRVIIQEEKEEKAIPTTPR